MPFLVATRGNMFRRWKLLWMVKVIFDEWDWSVHHDFRIDVATFIVNVPRPEPPPVIPDTDSELELDMD